MMDFYSEFPAPEKSAATKFIVNTLYPEYEPYGIGEQDIYTIASAEYDAFGSLGSQAAWLSITSHKLIDNVRDSINKRLVTNLIDIKQPTK